MVAIVRQSIDNLHDSITEVVVDAQKSGFYGRVLEVIDPSPGLWGGAPVEGLVTIVYECAMPVDRMHGGAEHPAAAPGRHCHHALFGPVDEKDRQPGEAVEEYSLYAD
jgi:hypothetical protein